MSIGNVLQAATIAVASGAGAAVGNLTVASFAVSTRPEPVIVFRLDRATAPKQTVVAATAAPDCKEIDTTGSETHARILDCGERVMPARDVDVRP